MINLFISNEKIKNLIFSLVKAFYPDKEITFNKTNDNENYIIIEDKTIKIDLSDEKDRYAFQRKLYNELASMAKKELPWGVLTGIRPTKLVLESLESGHTNEDIINHMNEKYYVSNEKINLSIDIAKRELDILNKIDYKNACSLYIGIPFCPSTCLYCSFTSYSIDKFAHLVEDYLDALEKEIIYAKACIKDKKISTIYIGGGTPTSLNESQLERLLKLIHKHFNVKDVVEFCVEAGRPDSITYEKLRLLKEYNVTRISINPQTMVDRTLKLIGRNHISQDIVDTYKMAKKAGHDNINMDLIIGLPCETVEDVNYTLREINRLNPECITVHTLAIKRAAKLNIEKNNYKRYNAINVSDMLDLTMDYARTNEYLPYYLYRQKNMTDNLENIGYAKAGKEGIYNILIMEERQTIIALGAGSVSKYVFFDDYRVVRDSNVKSVTDYINRIDELIERKDKFIKW